MADPLVVMDENTLPLVIQELILSVQNQFQVQLAAPVGARLQDNWLVWKNLGASQHVTGILRDGLRVQWRDKRPPLSRVPLINSGYQDPVKDAVLLEHVQLMLQKKAIERVIDVHSPGFYSRLFVVPKKGNKGAP